MPGFGDIDGGTYVIRLTPRARRTRQEVCEAVERELVSRVGAPASRAGNVLRVELYSDADNDDRLVLSFSVDIGTSPSLRDALAAIEKVAVARVLANAGHAMLSASA